MGRPRKKLKQGKTVAVGCDPLPDRIRMVWSRLWSFRVHEPHVIRTHRAGSGAVGARAGQRARPVALLGRRKPLSTPGQEGETATTLAATPPARGRAPAPAPPRRPDRTSRTRRHKPELSGPRRRGPVDAHEVASLVDLSARERALGDRAVQHNEPGRTDM